VGETSGSTLELSSATMVYHPGDMSTPVNLNQVVDAGACVGNDFYFQSPNTITLCPSICATVHADETEELQLEIDCVWPPAQ